MPGRGRRPARGARPRTFDVVSEAVTSVQQGAEFNGHRFVLHLPDEPLAASADREKLSQVLTNLLDNAVKFSPNGGTVTVEANRRAGRVEVRVVDEGQGIPEDERERIFSKFHRADSSPRGPAGAGLGLFIARGLVRAMGGRIWVDSAEGGGSSFAFELRSRRRSKRVSKARPGYRGKVPVLVIDDEEPIRLLCRVNLEATGIQVSEAEDGKHRARTARAERPDVILLDVMMPGMDGWQVFDELRKDESTAEIPIVFLTGRAVTRLGDWSSAASTT